MSESWKTKEVLENCLQYVSTHQEIIIDNKPVKFWPHARGYDCGPCELGRKGRCGRLPCMSGEGIPYGLPFVNWQTTPHTALIADLKKQLNIDIKESTLDLNEAIHPI